MRPRLSALARLTALVALTAAGAAAWGQEQPLSPQQAQKARQPQQAPQGRSIGLYLHEVELDAEFAVDFAGPADIPVAIYADDPTALFDRLVKTGLGRVELAPDHVEATVAHDVTFTQDPLPGDSRPSFVMDYDEAIFEPLLERLLQQYGAEPEIGQLVDFVDQTITAKTLERGFDLGSQVVRNRAGDCTEHAVLLTSLARATGRPARLVLGTVLAQHDGAVQAFAHAWSEIYDGQRWHLADAALAGARQEGVELRYLPYSTLANEGPGYGLALADDVAVSPHRISILRAAD